jgi:hypothetical protein
VQVLVSQGGISATLSRLDRDEKKRKREKKREDEDDSEDDTEEDSEEDKKWKWPEKEDDEKEKKKKERKKQEEDQDDYYEKEYKKEKKEKEKEDKHQIIDGVYSEDLVQYFVYALAYLGLSVLGVLLMPPFGICIYLTEGDLDTCSLGIWNNDYMLWSKPEPVPYNGEEPIFVWNYLCQ